MLLPVDTLGLVFVTCCLKSQTVVECYTKIHWIATMLELLCIQNDVKLFVGLPIFKMKSTTLGFRWIGSRVIEY